MSKTDKTSSGLLTPMEERWCRAYADPESSTYGLATASAKAAGFSESHNASWKIRRRPKVRARLAELYSLTIVAADKVMTDLENLRLRAVKKGDVQAAVRAVELQGKRLALFVEKNALILRAPVPRELTWEENRQADLIALVLATYQADGELLGQNPDFAFLRKIDAEHIRQYPRPKELPRLPDVEPVEDEPLDTVFEAGSYARDAEILDTESEDV